MRRSPLVGVVALAAVAALAFPTAARALPSVGEALPDVTLVDAWGKSWQIRRGANKPVLVIYEDRSSATQNTALKDELAKLAQGDRYKQSVALVAVADVASYDYWPARGFVKDAIREESVKAGTNIYCDWDGAFRSKLGLRRGVSTVVLYGADGKVLFSHEGSVPPERRAQLIALLKAQVGG
jgi:predicted transcriptional regulator